jgi:hypothetical protein
MISTMMRTTLLLATAATLGACASMPLGTMWKLRDFGPEQLARVDPAQVRLATRIEPGAIQLDPEQVALRITLTRHDGGAETHTFGVDEVHSFTSTLTGGDLAGWQAFRFDEESLALFRRFQPVLHTARDDFAQFHVAVEVALQDPRSLDGLEAIRLTTRLQLAANEDAFTLVDDAPFRIERPAQDAPAD